MKMEKMVSEEKYLDLKKHFGDTVQALIHVALLLPKHGKWIDCDGEEYLANCSVCGWQMDVHENHGYYKFCPHCGSDMRGDDDAT